jgi:ADP-ribose pyrophosphatase YjhB (NUDIX family)
MTREEAMQDATMTPAQQIALWADKLRDLSAMGLTFSQNPHDRESYEQIEKVALEMLALATGEAFDQIEPLRAPVFRRPSPIVGGDAAIIDDAGRILLIQRADNGKWAMPGGVLSVGETPAEGVVREALEETGVRCEPVALVAIHDSRLCGTVSLHHLYHVLFLCRPLYDGEPIEEPTHSFEVLDRKWFTENALPNNIDPGHVSRIPEAFRIWHGGQRAHFDRLEHE